MKKSITEETARAIHAARGSYAKIAEEHGVTVMTVSHIKSGKTWKKLGLQPSSRHKSLEKFQREQQRNSELPGQLDLFDGSLDPASPGRLGDLSGGPADDGDPDGHFPAAGSYGQLAA